MPNTKVVAISGASGAGKTTIVKQLASKFDCPFLLQESRLFVKPMMAVSFIFRIRKTLLWFRKKNISTQVMK